MLVGIAVYGGVLYWYGEEEFDPEHGELLTTRVAKPLYAAVQEVYFVNAFNGREATVEEAEAASRQPLVSISHWSPNIINVSFGDREKIARVGNDFWTPVVRPDVREFMQVVHLLAALTLGYVAGKFNAALYRRRRALPAGNGVREPVVREGEASSPTPAAETDSPR
ncbi:MAG TPA: hypothetical protein VGN57_09955 [Pirellulaceae bacterium]|nr:hypothetical protein [Pirellulaceae bacterium]